MEGREERALSIYTTEGEDGREGGGGREGGKEEEGLSGCRVGLKNVNNMRTLWYIRRQPPLPPSLPPSLPPPNLSIHLSFHPSFPPSLPPSLPLERAPRSR